MQNLYSYLGYEYCPWDDVEEDNIKTFHECYKDGVRIKMPYEFYNHSPYATISYAEFVKHVQSIEVFVQG
jgi:hypothetical protein